MDSCQSLDTVPLISHRSRAQAIEFSEIEHVPDQSRRKNNMGSETITERHTSYGRGGAGNLRRLSDIRTAEAALATLQQNEQNGENAPKERRRSSVWSTGEGSLWKNATNALRRGSTNSEN